MEEAIVLLYLNRKSLNPLIELSVSSQLQNRLNLNMKVSVRGQIAIHPIQCVKLVTHSIFVDRYLTSSIPSQKDLSAKVSTIKEDYEPSHPIIKPVNASLAETIITQVSFLLYLNFRSFYKKYKVKQRSQRKQDSTCFPYILSQKQDFRNNFPFLYICLNKDVLPLVS